MVVNIQQPFREGSLEVTKYQFEQVPLLFWLEVSPVESQIVMSNRICLVFIVLSVQAGQCAVELQKAL